jgi:enediyne biosynthesis protein E4
LALVIQSLLSRRSLLKSLSRSALVLAFDDVLSLAMPLQTVPVNTAATEPLGMSFINIAREAGLNAKTIYGGEKKNKYLLETTGCGVAFYDYDHDDWLDIFLVNGWRLEGFPKGQEPVCHLFKNNRDGTFTDVTLKAGVAKSGWGQGVCVGDYDNDGHDDLFITYFGKNVLFHNNGNGTFTDVSEKSGVAGRAGRWNTGCAFVDYDRDGHLDLFIANYIDMDLETAPTPDSGSCLYKSIQVACGPPGLKGGKNILLRNNRNGKFTDVSEKAGILASNGTYGLGVLVSDFNNDGWPDIYVANDSTASSLYRNQNNGTFTDISIEAGAAYSPDGKPQAGMGVGAGDYDHDGNLDILKTNFAGDTHSLYRNEGKDSFEDTTFVAGLGLNTRYLGWGCGFLDIDNDGWTDALVINGHVYPEVEKLKTEAAYQQRKLLYRNLRNSRFEDVSQKAGPGISSAIAGRGCAFGDFDNDGDVDIAINVVNGMPELLRCDSRAGNNWIKVKTIGVKSNRSGIGARVRCVARSGKELLDQVDEVRSGGSYFSQNDLRLHFGLAKSERVDLLEIRWPSGQIDAFKELPVNQMIIVKEGDPKFSTQRWGKK